MDMIVRERSKMTKGKAMVERNPALIRPEREEIFRVLQDRVDRQEWGKAISDLRRLIQLLPQEQKLQLQLAHLYWKGGNIEKALEEVYRCAQGFCKEYELRKAMAAATSILSLQPNSELALKMVRDINENLDSVRKTAAYSFPEILLEFLPRKALEELMSCLRLLAYPEGAQVVKKGDAAFHFFIVCRGEVQVILTDKDGLRFNLGTLREGDFFGETELLTGALRMVTIVTAEPSDFLVLEKLDFDRLMNKYPEFAEVVHQYSSRWADDTVRQIRARGIERRRHSRLPVRMVARAVMMDVRGNQPVPVTLQGLVEDLSEGGAWLRVQLSNLQQWDQLRKVREVRLSFASFKGLTCSVKRVQHRECSQGVDAYLGLSFRNITENQQEELKRLIEQQLVTCKLPD